MNEYKNHPLYKKHNMDSALGSVWDFYKTNFLPLFVVSLVMSLILQYATTMVNMQELQEMSDITAIIEKMKEMIVPVLIISLASMLFTTILQHYIIYKPIDSGYSILDSLLKSLKYFFPFLVIMILLSFFGAIALVAGVIALIIGALFAIVYIMLLYLFILPLLMIEGPNIGNTISRTFTLAHRNFWSNIGMVAVFLIILIVISIVLSALIMIPFSGNMIKSILDPTNAVKPDFSGNPLFIILSSVVNALTLPLIPIFACIMYFNARAGEDEIMNKPQEPTEYRPSIEDLYSRPKDDVDK
jgi:hypothetical protein